jgi:hypothetical protein
MGQDASNGFLPTDSRRETPTRHLIKRNSFFLPSRSMVNSRHRIVNKVSTKRSILLVAEINEAKNFGGAWEGAGG